MSVGRILIIDDGKGPGGALEMALRMDFESVKSFSNPNLLPFYLKTEKADVAILDVDFSGVREGEERGLYWLREIKRINPRIEVVILLEEEDVMLGERAIEEGAANFAFKRVNTRELVASLRSIVQLKLMKERCELVESRFDGIRKELLQSKPVIQGSSVPYNRMMYAITGVIDTPDAILLQGETGSGKKTVARYIHNQSSRRNELFLEANHLLERETELGGYLFGVKKRNYPTADPDLPGKFQLAEGGTLYIPEVAKIPLSVQDQFLRYMEKAVVEPVGASRSVPVNVKLLLGTAEDLKSLVEEGVFHEELYRRLSSKAIEIPALRHRVEDIEDIANFFISQSCAKYHKGPLRMSARTLEELKLNQWPGNISELKLTIEKGVILCEEEVLRPEDFRFRPVAQSQLFKIPDTIEEMEKSMIKKALERHKNNHSAAAAQLGITRQTLYNKIRKYKL
ncbi:sigma-54 dependent transcriptional regulator [Prolixibacter sp. SD074]|jgi:DNA-binding NtrC family response regulator|uniref:sigma-54-dependent transcriptional regulator n=1 Tax=Prolixibacter sp. SD074 TaxID=2652391 RepID=UPI001274783B|nr:sigma 54-interacting transcriptional regulator [Prolixibacter sp. SD074]GET30858.1 sigma-54-dependent Fis family transcriptional regulator [Prolixibacter sp. SD074]